MPGGGRQVIALTLYSRPGCHLCDEMKAVINRVAESTPLQLEEIDISTSHELEERYGLEIPVLMVEGKKAAKYRIARGGIAANPGWKGRIGRIGRKEQTGFPIPPFLPLPPLLPTTSI